MASTTIPRAGTTPCLSAAAILSGLDSASTSAAAAIEAVPVMTSVAPIAMDSADDKGDPDEHGDREEQVVEPLVERQFLLCARLFHHAGAERRACARARPCDGLQIEDEDVDERRDRGEHQTCDDHFVLLVVDGPVEE